MSTPWNVRLRRDLLAKLRAAAVQQHWSIQYTHERVIELGLHALKTTRGENGKGRGRWADK